MHSAVREMLIFESFIALWDLSEIPIRRNKKKGIDVAVRI